MKKLFTLTILAVLALAVNAQGYRKWDFTNWSASTIASLQAEDAAGVTGGNWSSTEKANGDNPQPNNCYWSYAANVDENGNLMANGAIIQETEGLKFNTSYTSRRSLAIAVNYPSTSLGDYGGPQYLWLGGGNAKSVGARIYCFIIPKVKVGQKITIMAESHKPSDARGVALFAGDCTDDANQIGEQFKPTTLETYTWEEGWQLPEGVEANEDETVDIQVYNTNGCHLYSIEVGNADQKSKVAYLYDGTADAALAAIQARQNTETVAINVTTESITADSLKKFDVTVLGNSVPTDNAYMAMVKEVLPWTPVLNLNSAAVEAWGYGTSVTMEGVTSVVVPEAAKRNSLFSGVSLTEDEGVTYLDLTDNEDATLYGVQPGEYFVDDTRLAFAMNEDGNAPDSSFVAVQTYNLGHNGYIYLPNLVSYTEAAQRLISNAIGQLMNSKSEVKPAVAPMVKCIYKDQLTRVVLTASSQPKQQIFYTTDGTEPTAESTLYTDTISITNACTLKAVAIAEGYLLSDVTEQEIILKSQAAKPAFELASEEGKTTVTITSNVEGASIYYNYSGSADKAKSSLYTEPVVITKPKTIYAFVEVEGMVDSEVASQMVNVTNATLRIDILAHMDANSAEYNNGSTSTAYYFSWGKNKSGENGHPYYNPDVFTQEEPTVDPETGDEIAGKKVYTELNTEEEVDFNNGWAIRSRGQIVDWENLESGTKYGDNSGYNFATIEDNDPDFPATKGLINLADKNTEPADATFPYNAYIVSTEKFKGPFDVIAYVGSIVKPENEAKHQFVIETSVDGNAWDSAWEVLGDTVLIQNKQRLTTLVTRSYEGTDSVYVRLYLTNFNSKIGIYDLYIANAGEKSQERTSGITTQKSAAAVKSAIYSLNGLRQQSLRRGLNIVVSSDGTVKKVMVK